MLIKAMIFDMDGTLLDSEAISSASTDYAFRTVLGRGLTPEENAKLIGRPVSKVLSEWYPDTGNKIYELSKSFFHERVRLISSYPGVKNLISDLVKNYRLAVVTSSKRKDADILLKNTALDGYMDFFIGQEDTEFQKPDPEPIKLALHKLGVHSREAVFVGDQPYDIIAAHQAEVVAIGTTWGSGDRETLEMYHPDYIVNKPEELKDLLDLLS
ncbi:MAG: HAD-IA family hydrolase [Thermoplasmatales archaeon]|nr:HAD-IA family hydrolase [Thermoplasmatales archaeon]MCW6170466.1 HAD-IA family hydrolase [Thermoplasmatales archaeon]